jgi:hypothetical protein
MKGFRDLELSIANRQMAIKENRPAVWKQLPVLFYHHPVLAPFLCRQVLSQWKEGKFHKCQPWLTWYFQWHYIKRPVLQMCRISDLDWLMNVTHHDISEQNWANTGWWLTCLPIATRLYKFQLFLKWKGLGF